jgi:hypothetical protein
MPRPCPAAVSMSSLRDATSASRRVASSSQTGELLSTTLRCSSSEYVSAGAARGSAALGDELAGGEVDDVELLLDPEPGEVPLAGRRRGQRAGRLVNADRHGLALPSFLPSATTCGCAHRRARVVVHRRRDDVGKASVVFPARSVRRRGAPSTAPREASLSSGPSGARRRDPDGECTGPTSARRVRRVRCRRAAEQARRRRRRASTARA